MIENIASSVISGIIFQVKTSATCQSGLIYSCPHYTIIKKKKMGPKEATKKKSDRDPRVSTLASFCVKGEEKGFATLFITSLVNKLKSRDQHSEYLDNLIIAVTTRGSQETKCVPLQSTKDGRMQIDGKKFHPHVMSCKLWRWADVGKAHLSNWDFCEYGFQRKNNDIICVNPYHYKKTDQSKIQPFKGLQETINEYPNKIDISTHQQQQEKSPLSQTISQYKALSESSWSPPTNFNDDQLSESVLPVIFDRSPSEEKTCQNENQYSQQTLNQFNNHNKNLQGYYKKTSPQQYLQDVTSNVNNHLTSDGLYDLQQQTQLSQSALRNYPETQIPEPISKNYQQNLLTPELTDLSYQAQLHQQTQLSQFSTLNYSPEPIINNYLQTNLQESIGTTYTQNQLPELIRSNYQQAQLHQQNQSAEPLSRNYSQTEVLEPINDSYQQTQLLSDPSMTNYQNSYSMELMMKNYQMSQVNNKNQGNLYLSSNQYQSHHQNVHDIHGTNGQNSIWKNQIHEQHINTNAVRHNSNKATLESKFDYWCSINYYEFDKQVGETFKVKVRCPLISIDGFFDPDCEKRFCLGVLSNVHRTPQSEKVRKHIGRGVCLESRANGDVYLRCDSEYNIFLQSYYLDKVQGRCPGDFVHKISHNSYVKVFDLESCYQSLKMQVESAKRRIAQKAAAITGGLLPEEDIVKETLSGINIDDLRKYCILRMSFVKGWGLDYPKRSIEETPCWIEVHLHKALKRLDDVLQYN